MTCDTIVNSALIQLQKDASFYFAVSRLVQDDPDALKYPAAIADAQTQKAFQEGATYAQVVEAINLGERHCRDW